MLAGCPRFTVVLPAVMFAQVCGGLLVLAAKLIAIRFVQQLLFETLHRKYSCPDDGSTDARKIMRTATAGRLCSL